MKSDEKKLISKENAIFTLRSGERSVCGIFRKDGETVHPAPPVSWSKNDQCECVCEL